MTAVELVLAGLAFALIGALLTLRLAEAFSRDRRPETTEPTPPGGEPEPRESVPDEDRVLELLAENDGRLRQQAVVDRTDWSKSKVSRLLSRMEERGTIRKVPVGRENVVELAGEELTGNPEENDG